MHSIHVINYIFTYRLFVEIQSDMQYGDLGLFDDWNAVVKKMNRVVEQSFAISPVRFEIHQYAGGINGQKSDNLPAEQPAKLSDLARYIIRSRPYSDE